MSLVKLKSLKGVEIYVNPDHVAILSPSTIVNQSAITLPMGLSIEIEDSAKENAPKLGWVGNILSE